MKMSPLREARKPPNCTVFRALGVEAKEEAHAAARQGSPSGSARGTQPEEPLADALNPFPTTRYTTAGPATSRRDSSTPAHMPPDTMTISAMGVRGQCRRRRRLITREGASDQDRETVAPPRGKSAPSNMAVAP